jgi:hypothetical protein
MLLRNCAVIGNGMIAKRTLAKILEARVVDTVTGLVQLVNIYEIILDCETIPGLICDCHSHRDRVPP